MNVDLAADAAYEDKSLREILDAPVDALQGISAAAAKPLGALGCKTFCALARWKYAL